MEKGKLWNFLRLICGKKRNKIEDPKDIKKKEEQEKNKRSCLTRCKKRETSKDQKDIKKQEKPVSEAVKKSCFTRCKKHETSKDQKEVKKKDKTDRIKRDLQVKILDIAWIFKDKKNFLQLA